MEKARLQASFSINPEHVSPEQVLKIKRAAKTWAAAGVAISVGAAGLTIGLALANGQLQPDSPAFSQFLAEQIAGVIVDVFLAVLDVLIVVVNLARLGTVLAIFAIIDAVIAVVCAATDYDQQESGRSLLDLWWL